MLVLEEGGPVFISEDPVTLDEFISSLKALHSMDALPKKLWDLKIMAEGGWVHLTLRWWGKYSSPVTTSSRQSELPSRT
ncbi:hypothetical protein [Thermococcus sp. JCM 11816]|uniref:hypothetical protein n=1 Tax=Thermococcus sp. (strain JCM 11816 / KS-1) TaxID=1295125 RepID=UPI0034650534